MSTNTDTQFATRFPGVTLQSFLGNEVSLKDFAPVESPINLGMYDDIGRATLYGYDRQPNFWSRFLRSPLSRGDAEMTARFTEVTSRAYDPDAPDTDLFNGQRPSMVSSVATKNLSRQVYTEVNDYVMKQFVQTEDMIGDAISIIQAANMNAYYDDMWVASKEYFSGSVRDAPVDSQVVMTHAPGETGFAEEMSELLFDTVENKFRFKSTLYNPAAYNTRSDSVSIAMKKSCDYPTFRKMYSDTFHPDLLKIPAYADYVDDFATPAGKPEDAGDLIAIVTDDRTWSITPMPDTMSTEAFRNPVRKSTSFATTYEYAFHTSPFFNIRFIYEPAAEGE